jgi:hypothetical protein
MPIHDWTKVRAGTFHNFHVLWTGSITNELNSGRLPNGYFAMAEQIVGRPEGDIIALERGNGRPRKHFGNGAMATAPTKPKSRFVLPMKEQRYAEKASRIAIRHELGDVVAVIEIVSPGNKSNQNAMRTFREKSSDLIRQGVSLLIVDLFPPGPRDPQGIHKAIWDEFTDEPFELPAGKPLTLAAYQAEPEITAYVEPVAVGDSLPDMPLFIDGDFYVNVPLEATYATTWSVLPKELKALLA